MDNSAPVDKDSKEATFAALAADFGLDDKVKDLFLKGPMEDLQDFNPLDFIDSLLPDLLEN